MSLTKQKPFITDNYFEKKKTVKNIYIYIRRGTTCIYIYIYTHRGTTYIYIKYMMRKTLTFLSAFYIFNNNLFRNVKEFSHFLNNVLI